MITRGLAYLRRLQTRDGGFALVKGRAPDAQSTAWAIQAFVAAGTSPGQAGVRLPRQAAPRRRQLPLLEALRRDAGLGHLPGASRRWLASRSRSVSLAAWPGRVTASIITIGNELLSGDTVNTNASWLAQQLEELGVTVTLMASLPDEIERIAAFVRTEAERADFVLVTGGLGGTPDDVTREAMADAFEAPQDEVVRSRRAASLQVPRRPGVRGALGEPSRAARGRSRTRSAARPGFVVGNVYVLPGLPAEMKAMFATFAVRAGDRAADHLVAADATRRPRRGSSACSRRWATAIRACWSARTRSSTPDGATVEVVVKSSDPGALEAAVAWIERALEEATS